jgi:hypothetical protein
MTLQKEPNPSVRSLNFLRHEDGSWNLLVIAGGALGVVFVAYMLQGSPAPAPVKVVAPAQTQAPIAAPAVSK